MIKLRFWCYKYFPQVFVGLFHSQEQGVGHHIIKFLNISAIQCKFNCCLNNCTYRLWCCEIIWLFQISWVLRFDFDPRSFKKSLNYALQKYNFPNMREQSTFIKFQWCIYLRLDGKFHTHTCTCAGLIDENQTKTDDLSVAMFLFQDFLCILQRLVRSLRYIFVQLIS